MTDDRELWRLAAGSGAVACVMRSCCGGAELQIVQGDDVLVRELYPTKSDLYERARALEAEYRSRHSSG